MKAANVNQHHNTKHAHCEQKYLQNTEVRSTKVNRVKSSYQASSKIIIIKLMTQQELAMEPSLGIAWVLSKHKKPFSDTELDFAIRDVMMAMLEKKAKG